MVKYEKKEFSDVSIVIDGNEYIECRFSRCEIIFAGGSLPRLIKNSFDSCRFAFDGPAARAIQFMAALYQGGAQNLIEATFENVRGKPATGLALH